MGLADLLSYRNFALKDGFHSDKPLFFIKNSFEAKYWEELIFVLRGIDSRLRTFLFYCSSFFLS